MGRLPYQVLVILYRHDGNSIKYCIFEREIPNHQIQFIAGGGENNETPLQAAMREVYEESGITDVSFQQLTSICYIPTNVFTENQRQIWGKDVFVIPEYSYGARVKSDKVTISNEHTGYKWVSYDEAISQLKWDSNKTALYELNCKLALSDMPDMTAEEVVKIIKLFEENGIEVYVDGGWGVDALLGTQTRKHDDLDIALPHRFVPKLRELLESRGYKDVPRSDTRDCNFVLSDDKGHFIDVHTFTIDESGKNVFGVAYEPRHLTGFGTINAYPVKCPPPEVMVEFHTGYNVDENDFHDMTVLCERFGFPLPKDYEKFSR